MDKANTSFSVPSDIQASSPLSAFRQRLKTFLFCQSFPDIVPWSHYAFVVYAIVFAILATLKNMIDIDIDNSHRYDVTRQMVYRGPSKDQQSAHQCTVYILWSQVQVQMSTVELTWVWSIGCVVGLVPVQWLSVDKRKQVNSTTIYVTSRSGILIWLGVSCKSRYHGNTDVRWKNFLPVTVC